MRSKLIHHWFELSNAVTSHLKLTNNSYTLYSSSITSITYLGGIVNKTENNNVYLFTDVRVSKFKYKLSSKAADCFTMTQCKSEVLLDISLVEAIIRNVTPYISNVQVKTIEEVTFFRPRKKFVEAGDGCTKCHSFSNMELNHDCIKKGGVKSTVVKFIIALMLKRLVSICIRFNCSDIQCLFKR